MHILLFSAKKRETYLMEMKRLREGNGCMLPYPGLLGSLIAADMRLPLKPEFMAKWGTVHGKLSSLVFPAIVFFFISRILLSVANVLKFLLSIAMP